MTTSVPFSITPPLEDQVEATSHPDTMDCASPSLSNNSLPDRTLDSEKEVGEGSPSEDGVNISASEKISKLLNGKDKEWAAVVEKKGPLQLLDLPLDILKEIMKQVSHTSDLTSIALCHSSLHALAVPHIYSRFDIVWPDAHATSDHRTGVDALTYGLATLVMAEEVFGEAPFQRNPPPHHACTNCGHVNQASSNAQSQAPVTNTVATQRTRRGNYFAQYTRKFSLGNGPPDWVQEYMITKEGGKMLGTLVALAVARMINLETFIWDMPTGVLRDVWIALSSLGHRIDGQPCRLERVWVRWHDNSDGLPAPSLSPQSGGNPPQGQPGVVPPIPGVPAAAVPQLPQILPFYRVEYPTFSVLPPLRSLSVLEIDELPYVEEMSILIERSKEKLRELRVGIAPHALKRDWVNLVGAKPTPGSVTGGPIPILRNRPKTDGVLGILVSKICLIHDELVKKHSAIEIRTDGANSIQKGSTFDIGEMPGQSIPVAATSSATITSLGQELEAPSTPIKLEEDESGSSVQLPTEPTGSSPQNCIDLTQDDPAEPSSPTMPHVGAGSQSAPPTDATSTKDHIQLALEAARESSQTRLRLETLELERVPLSIPVLQRSINWSRLTSLTILRCPGHEDLWKALRRRYTPLPTHSRTSSSSRQQKPVRDGTDIHQTRPLRPMLSSCDYHLNLKRLQTDAVSPALIAFLKDSLAPNSLEWLFLQASRAYESTVSIDAIYKGPIRRHRGSLRKLLVDSEDREDDGQPAHNTQWRRWIFPRELLTFMTSGRMPNLREAGMALDYKDWHFFLQRLPQITQLRSIYIPYIADHVHGRNLDSRELALQILDIAALRPDLQICYLGIQAKCFEILETKSSDTDIPDVINGPQDGLGGESDVESEEDDDDNDNTAMSATPTVDLDGTDSESYADPHGDSDEDCGHVSHEDKNAVQLKLREILFYDDKVSIFKARHGRL